MKCELYHHYIDEIQQYPQITVEEERALANDIKAKYNFQQGEIPEEVNRKAQDAINKLVISNLKLVVKIANGVIKNENDRMDLISEGNKGLMRAAETFDPDKGAKFSVYSSFWIKQFINRYVYGNSNLFKLPDKVWSNKYKVGYFIEKYQITNKRMPTVDEISKELEISVNAVINVLDMDRKVINLDTSSLDEDSGSCNEEVVTLDNGKVPDNHCMSHESLRLVEEIVKMLPERERNIITRRYGLDGNQPETLQTIGQDYNLTQERIRQLENLVIRQLRTILSDKLVDINPLGSTLVYT